MSARPLVVMGDVLALVRQESRPAGDTVLSAVAESLEHLVPADLVAWQEIDLGARRVALRTFPDGRAQNDEVVRSLLATADDNPMVRSYTNRPDLGDLSPRRLSDLVSARELRRTRAYAELFRPLGGLRQVTMLTVRSGRISARCWGFNRSAADFSDEEVDLLATIRPLLSLLEQLIAVPSPPRLSAQQRWGLTARESEIVAHLASGLTADAIGRLCGISGGTVRKHLEHAYAKMGTHDRLTALLRFRENQNS